MHNAEMNPAEPQHEPGYPVQTSLTGLGGVAQPPLPGLPEPIQPPLMALVSEEEEEAARIEPMTGQLTFGPQQTVLTEAEASPVQLSMLPDPPIWESDGPSVTRKRPEGRLGRKRTKAGIGPGQTSLF